MNVSNEFVSAFHKTRRHNSVFLLFFVFVFLLFPSFCFHSQPSPPNFNFLPPTPFFHLLFPPPLCVPLFHHSHCPLYFSSLYLFPKYLSFHCFCFLLFHIFLFFFLHFCFSFFPSFPPYSYPRANLTIAITCPVTERNNEKQ